ARLGLLLVLQVIELSQWTVNPIFDGIASVVIGLILGTTASWLAYETKGLLIGESADPKVVEGIKQLVGSYQEITSVNETLTLHMGPNYIVLNISVNFKDELHAGQIERTIEDLTSRIREKYPRVNRIFIEAEDRVKALDH